jgi:hypothetical protein
MDFAKMHSLSDSIFAQASALHAHVLQQLAGAEHSLDCCSLSHQVSNLIPPPSCLQIQHASCDIQWREAVRALSLSLGFFGESHVTSMIASSH